MPLGTLAQLAFMGGSALGGWLGNRKGARTGTQSSTDSGSTRRILTPYQENIQSPLFGLVDKLLKNPKGYLEPFRQSSLTRVNDMYANVPQILRNRFLSSGGGASGKFGTATRMAEMSRLGDLSRVNQGFAEREASLPLEASSLAQQLLGMNFGSEYSGSREGQYTQPGSAAASGIGSGLSTLLSLLGINAGLGRGDVGIGGILSRGGAGGSLGKGT